MTDAYDQLRARAENGELVVIAAGRVGPDPVVAWLAAPLRRPGSVQIAFHPDDFVRVGQMLGALEVVREHFRAHGFTPA